MQRELSDMVTKATIAFGANRLDYTDSAGVKHYQVLLADLPSAGTIIDRRPVEPIGGPLVQHFAARVGDYEQLRARATTKDDVDLGNLPNAISDDQDTNSSVILATTKAVKVATIAIWNAIANIVSGATVVGKAAKLAVARKITVTGAVTGTVDFDGSGDVTLTAVAAPVAPPTPAAETVAGVAKIATQIQTNSGVDDTSYVTPKKLRWGFAISLTTNGYVVFPTWLGGVVFQWGYVEPQHRNADGFNLGPIAFPIEFPTRPLTVIGVISPGEALPNTGMDNFAHVRTVSKTNFSLFSGCGVNVAFVYGAYWLAFGH